MAPEGVRSLTPEESLRYFNDFGFRATVHAEEGGLAVRFNLGQRFTEYITSAEFRMRVLAVLGEDRDRLAGLTDLRELNLSRSQGLNLAAVGALMNLGELSLISVGGVPEISILKGLVNLTLRSMALVSSLDLKD